MLRLFECLIECLPDLTDLDRGFDEDGVAKSTTPGNYWLYGGIPVTLCDLEG